MEMLSVLSLMDARQVFLLDLMISWPIYPDDRAEARVRQIAGNLINQKS
jgi:hypothetical protein